MRVESVLRIVVSLGLVCFAPATAGAQLAETEIPGVFAQLIELRQQGGALRLAIRLVNDSAKAATGDAIYLSQIVLVDAKSKAKHFVVKSADGNFVGGPTTDWNQGGRWFVSIAARSHVVLWAIFESLAAGTVVSVQAPRMFPFDDVKVSEGAGTFLSNSTTTSEIAGLTASLVSARRADQQLTIRMRVTAGATVQAAPTILYKDVFFFDPRTKRKYPVVKDIDGNYQAQPLTDRNSGGRFMTALMQPRGVALVSLTLQAPPDAVAAGDLLFPGFLPVEGLEISGSGGAATGGLAAAGRSVGLESALMELKAAVTPDGIAIDLAADVLFDFDKADLKPSADSSLQRLLTVVTDKSASTLTIIGHTDTRGESAYNLALSERRANAVKAWLVAHGVGGARITASGAGESRPRDPANTEEAHKANRRVAITIKG